jgi:hypothetical protein
MALDGPRPAVQTTVDYRAQGSTRDDAIGRDLAFRSGANGISTNYLVPDRRVGAYHVSFRGNRFVERASLSPGICCARRSIAASSQMGRAAGNTR